MTRIDRDLYALLYGPTAGDLIALGDTGLQVRVEVDDTPYGDEILGGCGKTYRESMLATSSHGSDSQLDMLVSSVVVLGLGGVWDVGVNPDRNLLTMLAAWGQVPVNAAFVARGSSISSAPLEAAMESGASGFKVHEDFGAYPTVIDSCLGVAEAHDVAVALHTDSLGESGMLTDTVAATRGRTVHA